MLRRLFSVLALGVSVLGCSVPRTMAPDPAFTAPERIELQRAADTWNELTKPEYRIALGEGWWRILKVAPPLGYNGQCSINQRTIWIHPDHPGATLYDVALHEMGHALGLGHTETGVMQAFVVSHEITPEVMAECLHVGACK